MDAPRTMGKELRLSEQCMYRDESLPSLSTFLVHREYMIELEDYLAIMQEYMENRFTTYCKYCEKCMYSVYEQWSKENANNRQLFSMEEDGWRDIVERELGNNYDYTYNYSNNQQSSSGHNYAKYCPEYFTCKYYTNTCKQGLDEDISEYFQCTETDSGAYIGPHCASDGETITLGVYADANCNQYMGDNVDISYVLGDEVDQEAIDSFVTGSMTDLMPEGYQEQLFELYGGWEAMCIPCRDGAIMYNGVSKDDYKSVNELCSTMYKNSAKCDKHFRNYAAHSKNALSYDANEMQLQCDFIDAMTMGKYDEMGFVNLEESSLAKAGFLKNNSYYESYGHYINEVSPLQIFGLCASLAACAILGLWSMALHKSLTNKGPWRPKKLQTSTNVTAADAFGRQSSGIGMARSTSQATSYYMT